MEQKELIVQVLFKPNCGLENTRASLVMRRIAPLCTTVSCHPRTVKSDRGTIPYICDNGFFIRFYSTIPEQVLLAIRGSFFVDRCMLVDDPDSIPPFEASTDTASEEEHAGALPSSLSEHNSTLSGREEDLTGLLAKFEEVQRELRKHADKYPQDRAFNDILFSHIQAVDALRTAVERSRVEPFDRLVPSLETLVNEYGRRFGIAVNLEVEEGHVALDRSVLATMEETIKRVIRSCIRNDLESPEDRAAAGKPTRGAIRLRVENDGSDVVCLIEHDGRALDTQLAGKLALERGLLTRPLETYTNSEIGSFLLLPRFNLSNSYKAGKAFSEYNEIGSMLQRVGGWGTVYNTERGTVEIALHFPVPFTVLEVALVRTGTTVFALPAQQIKQFEAFRATRMKNQPATEDEATKAPAYYLDKRGTRYEMLNEQGKHSPIEAEQPRYILLLESLGAKRALAVDEVHGYERVSVSQLPSLIDCGTARAMGCIGYAVSETGAPYVVISVRRLLNGETEGGSRA